MRNLWDGIYVETEKSEFQFREGSDGQCTGCGKAEGDHRKITTDSDEERARDKECPIYCSHKYCYYDSETTCCKCVKQRHPSWSFDGLACVACKNRQREQQRERKREREREREDRYKKAAKELENESTSEDSEANWEDLDVNDGEDELSFQRRVDLRRVADRRARRKRHAARAQEALEERNRKERQDREKRKRKAELKESDTKHAKNAIVRQLLSARCTPARVSLRASDGVLEGRICSNSRRNCRRNSRRNSWRC